jgi:hypothetical protein
MGLLKPIKKAVGGIFGGPPMGGMSGEPVGPPLPGRQGSGRLRNILGEALLGGIAGGATPGSSATDMFQGMQNAVDGSQMRRLDRVRMELDQRRMAQQQQQMQEMQDWRNRSLTSQDEDRSGRREIRDREVAIKALQADAKAWSEYVTAAAKAQSEGQFLPPEVYWESRQRTLGQYGMAQRQPQVGSPVMGEVGGGGSPMGVGQMSSTPMGAPPMGGQPAPQPTGGPQSLFRNQGIEDLPIPLRTQVDKDASQINLNDARANEARARTEYKQLEIEGFPEKQRMEREKLNAWMQQSQQRTMAMMAQVESLRTRSAAELEKARAMVGETEEKRKTRMVAQENHLRSEYLKSIELPFREVETHVAGMNNILANIENGTVNKSEADQVLIVAFNKLIDPGSVVRESEFARTPQYQDLVSHWEGRIKAIKEGGAGLTDESRRSLVAAANTLLGPHEDFYEKGTADYKRFAEMSGARVEAIMNTEDFRLVDTDRVNPPSGMSNERFDAGMTKNGLDPSNPEERKRFLKALTSGMMKVDF